MNNKFRIEKAGVEDLGRVVDLMRELAEFEGLLDGFHVTVELLKSYLFSEYPPAELLVAISDEIISGYALYFNNFSTFQGRPGMYLEDIYVEPSSRKQGIGKALLLEVVRIARERECHRFDWVVLKWNKRAQEFYESLGAKALDDWTLYRMDRDAMDNLLSS